MSADPMWSAVDGCQGCGKTREALGVPLVIDDEGDLSCPPGLGCQTPIARVVPATVRLAGVEVRSSALLSPEAVPPCAAATRAALAMAERELTLTGPSAARQRPVPTLEDLAIIAETIEDLAREARARALGRQRPRSRDLARMVTVTADLAAMAAAERKGAWR